MRFSLFGLETHTLFYQISLIFPIFEHFLEFWSKVKGVIHTLKMLKDTFLLKIYPRASKKLKFASICSADQEGFVTPSVHCAELSNNATTKNRICLLSHFTVTQTSPYMWNPIFHGIFDNNGIFLTKWQLITRKVNFTFCFSRRYSNMHLFQHLENIMVLTIIL